MTHSSVLLVCFWAFVAITPVSGQDSVRRASHVVVKFAPLSLVDIDATVQGAIELPIAAQTTIQLEGGYGWAGLSRSLPREGGITSKQTGRIRAEGRYYLPRTASFDDVPYPAGVYVAGEFLGKRISAERTQTAVFPCLVAPCPTNTERATVNRTVLGGHVKVGYQTGFGRSASAAFDPRRKESRIIFDVYLGVGARHIRVRQTAGSSIIPTNGNTPEGLRFTRFVPGRNFWARSASGGFKIGFAL
ncbi:hypothetical protein [Spirosoma arcticum]